jgi:hypothetical protein
VTFGPKAESPAPTEIAYTLSSLQTIYMKFVFPTVWIGGFATGSIFLLLTPGLDPNAAFLKVLFPIATVIGALFIWWTCMRLKRVRMDSRSLYISNYRTEIVVPLREVAEVTENVWLNIHPVTVKFLHETEFGSKVVFIPTQRWFAFWSSHPVVDKIRDAVARAGGGNYGRVGT